MDKQRIVFGENEIDLLKLDYQSCLNGYSYRDQLVADNFFKLVQVFSIFLTILLGILIFAKVHVMLHILLCIVLGLSGLIAMYSLLIDIASTSSSKIAIRKRSLEIEKKIGNGVIEYWDTIEKRKKYNIEIFLKGKSGQKKDREEKESAVFLYVSKILMSIYILIILFMIYYGLLLSA